MESDLGTVIVTGGASGIGAATARAVGAAGGTPGGHDPRPPAHGRDPELVVQGAPRAAGGAGGRGAGAAAGGSGGGLDGVVTAAAIDTPGQLENVAGETWENVVAVNLLGTVAVVRAALNHLERSRGRVVTVGSTLGLRAVSDATAYCASKFGVVGFTRALAAETQGRRGVTLLIPGGMQTAFFDSREEKYKPPPDMKLNRPEDVAQSILFALRQPPGCEVRELVITPSVESSWP